MLAGRATAVHRSTGRMRTRAPACSVTCWPWRALRLECRASFSGASDNSRCCPEGEEERRPRRTRLTTTRPHPTATDSAFRAFGTNRPKPSTRTERGSDAFPAPPASGAGAHTCEGHRQLVSRIFLLLPELPTPAPLQFLGWGWTEEDARYTEGYKRFHVFAKNRNERLQFIFPFTFFPKKPEPGIMLVLTGLCTQHTLLQTQ